MTHLCFHLLQSKSAGRAVGTPTRSLLPPNRGSGWWGMHPQAKPRSFSILEIIFPSRSLIRVWMRCVVMGAIGRCRSIPACEPDVWSLAEVLTISSERFQLEQSWISFPSSALFCVQETYPVKFLLFTAHDSSCMNDTWKQFKNKWSFGHLGSSSSEQGAVAVSPARPGDHAPRISS